MADDKTFKNASIAEINIKLIEAITLLNDYSKEDYVVKDDVKNYIKDLKNVLDSLKNIDIPNTRVTRN